MFYTLIGADIAMILAFIFKFQTLPPQIPLFYSKAAGEEQIVDLWYIVILPLILHLFYFINNFVYWKYFLGNEFIKKVTEYLNIFFIITITVIFIKILFLVG